MMLTTNPAALEIAKKYAELSNKDLIYVNHYLNIEFKKRISAFEKKFGDAQ